MIPKSGHRVSEKIMLHHEAVFAQTGNIIVSSRPTAANAKTTTRSGFVAKNRALPTIHLVTGRPRVRRRPQTRIPNLTDMDSTPVLRPR
jgi:hypothetical protein